MAIEAQYPYNLIGEIEPKSELTYNFSSASPSKKRTRDYTAYNNTLLDPLMEVQNMNYANFSNTSLPPAKMARVVDSGIASTSGRADFISCFNQFNAQTDALVQLQMERMRFAIKEVTKRQHMLIITTMEKQFANVISQKQDEIERISRYNSELETRLNQFNAEKQLWFNMAKNSESVIASLKSDLEQVLLQKNVKNGFNNSSGVIEGCGDSDEAESCCNGDEKASRKFVCKVCHEKECSVLMLPCRHLSVCDGCERKTEACPVCSEKKRSSVPVLLG